MEFKTKAYDYASSKSSSAVFIETHAKDFIAGYEQCLKDINSEKKIIMTQLQELVQKRTELKAVEKKYFDFESPKEYLKARKLRKKTEKAIFKILENEQKN